MSRSLRVTVGEFGVEVDKIGEQSLSFTGNAGCLGFDDVLRQRDLGAGRERRRLLRCRNTDLAGKRVSLIDDAAAVDIDVVSGLFEGTLFASDTLKLCEGIRCWDCSSSASWRQDGASEQVASAAGRRTPSFEDCWAKVPNEKGVETVDAGAAIARDKGTSLLAELLSCTEAEARFADRPASNCGASEEAGDVARTEGLEEDGRDNNDDGPRRGTREGASVRRMVSRVLTRS